MSDRTSLSRRASQYPIAGFLVVLVAYSAVVGTAIATVFQTAPPVLRVAAYAWGPLISAGAVTWLGDGSLRGWVGQLRHLRVRPRWYLAGVGVMLLGTEFETLVALALGGDVSVPAAPLPQYVLLFGVTLVFAGALEELGWRGFLQPRLQQRYSAVGSSVAIGVLWAVWHAPMILAGLGNFTAFWEYTLTIVAVSVIFGWLYNNTDAALPVVMVAHASHNLPPIGLPTSGVPALFATVSGDTVFYLICAVSVVAYTGARTLTRDGTVPNVPGRVERRSSRPES